MYFLFAEFFVLKRSVQLRMRTLVYENIHSISAVLILKILFQKSGYRTPWSLFHFNINLYNILLLFFSKI